MFALVYIFSLTVLTSRSTTSAPSTVLENPIATNIVSINYLNSEIRQNMRDVRLSLTYIR